MSLNFFIGRRRLASEQGWEEWQYYALPSNPVNVISADSLQEELVADSLSGLAKVLQTVPDIASANLCCDIWKRPPYVCLSQREQYAGCTTEEIGELALMVLGYVQK